MFEDGSTVRITRMYIIGRGTGMDKLGSTIRRIEVRKLGTAQE